MEVGMENYGREFYENEITRDMIKTKRKFWRVDLQILYHLSFIDDWSPGLNAL